MAQAMMGVADEVETASAAAGGQSEQIGSSHFATTLPSHAVGANGNDSTKSILFAQSNGNLSAGKMPAASKPRDGSPDSHGPQATTSKLHSDYDRPSVVGSKLPSSQSNEQPSVGPWTREIDDAGSGWNGSTPTPPVGSKSVQFSTDEAEQTDRETYTDPDKADQTKVQSIYSRLRALATVQGFSHVRSSSNLSASARSVDGKDMDGATASRSGRPETGLAATMEEDYLEADADAEESAAEDVSDQTLPRKRRRKFRRSDEIATAPSSPHNPLSTTFPSTQSMSQADRDRPHTLARRVTDTDASNKKQGMSEDEGRKQLRNSSPWTPRHPLRGLSYGGQRKPNEILSDGRDARVPVTSLNLNTAPSQLDASAAAGDTPKTSRRRLIAERGTTLSAAKWKQIKAGLKLLGQGKKKERTQDHEKSAELLAELAAGSPAALMLASMFQRDEHGSKRIPILLEQLKVSITDSEIDKYKESGNATPGDRHMTFRIELEYGNGINRMRWVVRRSLRDFANLHLKYKIHYGSQKLKGRGDSNKELPKFPKSAFPYLKAIRGLEDEGDEDEELPNDADGLATDQDRPGMKARSRTSFTGRRRSSAAGVQDANLPITPGGSGLQGPKRDARYPEKQRKKLELYLQRMIKFMLFRADANRLCKFLEVSALGMRLAAEGSYHGKEGFLVIRSAKGLDFRKALTPSNVKNRHAPKWFLVRHSYVVCVDSPEEMHIYDVFLFDSDFTIQSSRSVTKDLKSTKEIATTARDIAQTAKDSARHPQHHRLKLQNSERRLKLLARNERQLHQFEESIRLMIETSPWTKPGRFGSFAPVRPKCFAQWLVDGRDYMWVVSRALNQAKDVIYIHDWWLSPELYMRRPPAISQKWRLDRLLKRKAEQGVKIFIIVYRNIDAAVPIDSQYTKFSLLDLHPNVFVQRSPNQFRQNTFFWAHHEKLCIVDHTLAFVGGLDLCFGRWDTPQHTLVDDKPTGFEASEVPKDADHCQLWPGKDYSNPRIQDFYALNKPYEEMYNRSQIARMPWHDISMQIVGQPARDLTRHFVQRWNYILRQRKPTRPTPFLLPPPDFNSADLEALGLDGTCEVQVLRSAGPWSLGTPDKTEHSIMDAYVKMIEESEHFVYIENQFFISSCESEGSIVHNGIGDALVERITRASKNDEIWRACILIPLIPGFQNTVEQEGGTSVRLIMQYQYRSICRGESSIFGRLRAIGIDPEDFIQFYSLRQWGKIGPRQSIITEQLYIHAKCMIVDDRVAIIGSANINERSMLGNRDSECAAIVRDTDMVWSRMNGKPYKVGRFPHTLRMRLMREHLGLDVDKIMEDAQIMEAEHRKHAAADADHPQSPPVTHKSGVSNGLSNPLDVRGKEIREELLHRSEVLSSFNHDVDWEQKDNPNLRSGRKLTEDARITGNTVHQQDVEGHGTDNMAEIDEAGHGLGRDTTLIKGNKEVLITKVAPEGKRSLQAPRKEGDLARLPSYVAKLEAPNPPMPPRPVANRLTTEQLGLTMLSQLPALPDLDDTDIGGPVLPRESLNDAKQGGHPLLTELHRPLVDRDCMQDPIIGSFMDDTWHTIAENNTKIFRSVFRCMPDNQVRNWDDYHQYMAYEQRFNQLQGHDSPTETKVSSPPRSGSASKSGPPGTGTRAPAAKIKALSKVPPDVEAKTVDMKEKVLNVFGEKSSQGKEAEKEDQLHDWAADTNRAQMERQDRDLTRQTSTPSQDPKAGLETVPEHGATARLSGESSNTERATSSPSTTAAEKTPPPPAFGTSDALNINAQSQQAKRRRRATTRGSRSAFSANDDVLAVAEAEELLACVQGQLVAWPYDWLDKVEAGSNWLFPLDQISPIEIYI